MSTFLSRSQISHCGRIRWILVDWNLSFELGFDSRVVLSHSMQVFLQIELLNSVRLELRGYVFLLRIEQSFGTLATDILHRIASLTTMKSLLRCMFVVGE